MRHVVNHSRKQMRPIGAIRIGICVVTILLMLVIFAQRSAAQQSSLIIQGTNQKSLIKPADPALTATGKKDGQPAKRAPHRLIRKSQSGLAATLQPIPLDAPKPTSSSTAVSPSPLSNTTTQSKDTAVISTGTVAAPTTVPRALSSTAATTTITTATPNTIAPLSSSTGTTAFAGAGTAAASTNTSSGASTPSSGRSTSSLAAGMPGLSQLVSPSSSTPPPVPPAIGASPTSLSFTAQQGGSNPAAQTVSISNTGGGTLNWSASDNAAWLTLSPASGTGNGTVAVNATTGTLTAGSYSGTVTLSATGATPVTVPVSFTVTAAPANIGLNPASLSFTATQGAANPANQSMTINNTGGGSLSWNVSDNASWLSLNPTSGSSTPGPVTASVNTSGLVAGTYNAAITITANGAVNTPQTVPVSLLVTAPSTGAATLTWNASTSSSVVGYKVYEATASGAYGAPIATLQGNTTTYQAIGLSSGTTYFFTVTAYDNAGNESLHSNEVSKSIF